ncbi:MAG: hypothetical protein HKN62_05990 [Phycisphaerales bacterium]|nr:hypothetical protein [Phycisphaerales bacterium]
MPRLHVITMTDLADPPFPPADAHVSARTGAGLDTLRDRITACLRPQRVSVAADTVVLRPRHRDRLHAVRETVTHARELADADAGRPTLTHPELVASTLRRGLDELGEMIGRSTPDDVLAHIFSSFCVGK